MNSLLQNLLLCVALTLGYANVSDATENSNLQPGSGDIRIEIKDGSLSLETVNAPLHEVVRRIGELGGFKTILIEDFIDSPLVNVSFKRIAVREAVERLISEKNRIILYSPAVDGARPAISQVWLLGWSGEPGYGEASDEITIAPAQEKVVKAYKLDKLTRILEEDQNELVRARAAIALGALQDESAVPALESALLGEHSSVRSQIINALGRIGGERATMVLGNILLNQGTDKSERIMAAQVLQKQNSEAARDYLRLGLSDPDLQVRRESGILPSPVKTGPKTGRVDDAQAR